MAINRKKASACAAMFSILLAAALIISCTGAETKTGLDASTAPSMAWPKPPASPVVKYVRQIRNDLDIRPLSKAEMMFGPDKTQAFIKPSDIAVDRRGLIYVSDSGRNRIVIIDMDKGSIREFRGPGESGFALPLGLGYSAKLDMLAVAEGDKKSVLIFRLPDFALIGALGGSGEFINPVDAAIDADRGRIYVVDSKRHQVLIFGLDGKFISSFGKSGRADGELLFPVSIAIDNAGMIYVVDSFNFRVQVFTPDGRFAKAIGGHGDGPGMMSRPKAVAIENSPAQRVIVTDASTGNFQIFDRGGAHVLSVGSNGSRPGRFAAASGVFVDTSGKIYVADQGNRRIQIFELIKAQ